jgi:hypothetical protein
MGCLEMNNVLNYFSKGIVIMGKKLYYFLKNQKEVFSFKHEEFMEILAKINIIKTWLCTNNSIKGWRGWRL